MRLVRRLLWWIRRGSEHASLQAELAFHREQLEREFLVRGLEPAAARVAARRAMGDETYMREEARQVWIRPGLAAFAQDLRFALRGLRRSPGFSLLVVLALGLGIAAASAAFTLINRVILRPLPYPQAERLYTLFEQDSLTGGIQLASYPTFQDWHTQNDAFEGLAFVRGTGLTLRNGDYTGLALTAFVSEEFFPTLGAPALIGRALTADDFLPGHGGVAVLSFDLWRRAFGSDRSLVGRTLSIGNAPVTIVGVLEDSFSYPEWGPWGTDLWMPLSGIPPADLTALKQRDFHGDSRVIARLKAGITLGAASERMNTIAHRLAAAYPPSGQWTRVSLVSLTRFTLGDSRRRLWILGGAVGFVLLICCANVANLYLAQGAARQQEFAVRLALGAGGPRLFRQLFAETLLLVSLAGTLGLMLASWAVGAIRASSAAGLPRVNELRLDLGALCFTVALALAIGLGFAGLTAHRAAAPALAESLGERGHAGLAGARRRRLPSWLLVTQVAFTVVLLSGAALLVESFRRLSNVDPGFDPEGLILTRIEPPSPRYDDPEAVRQLYERVAGEVGAIPGIGEVALINHAPVGRGGLPSRAAIGHPPTGSADDLSVLFETVSAGYFATMRIPLVAGREFSEADLAGPPGPLIINETLARRWGGESPLGRRLDVLKAARTRPDFGMPLSGTVVGVARDVRHFGLDRDPPATVYVPYRHNLWASITLIARATVPPDPLLAAVDRAVRRVDPAIPQKGPGLGAGTVQSGIANSTAARRFNAALLSGFAILAQIMAAVGIYGVTSYSVALATREIGIRMALGATPWAIIGKFVRRVLAIALIGLGAGIVGALGLTRLIRGLLFGVAPTAPAVYLVVGFLSLAVAGIAAWIPAGRAAGVDPVNALKS